MTPARKARRGAIQLALVIIGTVLVTLIGESVMIAFAAPDVGGRIRLALQAAPLAASAGGVVAFAAAFLLTAAAARRLAALTRQSPAPEHGAVDAPRPLPVRDAGAPVPLAREDSLTGLRNHAAFQEEFDRVVEASRRDGSHTALVLIDLDNFRTLNDSAGHGTGDQLLVEVGRLLRAVLRHADLPFRIGGDEFAVLLPHSTVEDGYGAARRLLAAAVAKRPGSVYPDAFSFSAGVTGMPELGASRAELFEQADDALYAAKHEGRTMIKVYDPERSTRAVGAAAIGRASATVAAIIVGRTLQAVYQPIVELAGGRVVGYEGLVRPQSGAGFDNPASLFAAAEAAGRTAELDRLCLDTVLAGAAPLDARQSLALNISGRTLETPEFSVAWFSQLLGRAALAPERIVLELTEREPLTDVDVVRRRLAALQALGVRIAVDNVGASNAGLRLLSEIPFDIIKVDLTVVHAAARDGAARDVLRSVAELASRWGATAVAEGVETPAELRVIRDIGLPQAQGFLLGRPRAALDARSLDIDSLLAEPDLRASLDAGRIAPDLTLAWPSGLRGG
jgi:diguanylate cyclase (GGDEF)-like protein